MKKCILAIKKDKAMEKSKFSGHIAATFTLIIWGTTFLMSKSLMESFTTFQILLIRFILAYVVLSVMSLFSKTGKITLKVNTTKDEVFFILAGCLGLSIEAVCEIVSMKYTYTANTSVIVSTNPFFIGLASILFLKEKENVKWNFFLGFLVALIGAAIISFNGATEFGLNPLGDIIAFGSAISWAGYTILVAKLSDQGYSTLFITRRIYFWGFLSMLLANLIAKDTFNFKAMFIFPNIFYLLFLGIFASALGFVFWNHATKIISPVGASIYLYLTPVVTLISGVIVLKEKVNFVSIVGIITVTIGTWLSSAKLSKKRC